MLFPVVGSEEFPDGLVCIDCHQEILSGMPYESRPDCVLTDGALCEELVCIPCYMLAVS